MDIHLGSGWQILYDAYDTCEGLGLPREDDFLTGQGPQVSEWEELPQLKHLQLLFAEHPYWGRELRYFNDAPWWYRNEFQVDAPAPGEPAGPAGSAGAAGRYDHAELRFSGADYYCRVWLNGTLLGEHEGYSAAFSFDVTDFLRYGKANRLIVKVWSPWEKKIKNDNLPRRTFEVERNMVKGTYEHSDTFIARDVNPVGLCGDVTLKCRSGAWFSREPEFSYSLCEDLSSAALKLRVLTGRVPGAKAFARASLTDTLTGRSCWSREEEVPEEGALLEGTLEEPALWNTWDRGRPNTYLLKVVLQGGDGTALDCYEELVGLRTIDLRRTPEETVFVLNGEKLYVRGTSYFPDAYTSAMHEARWRDDLMKMKQLGFNFIRVHVHVEKPAFYRLCTELGLGIMQDSEYNWTHPATREYMERFMEVFLENVDQLKKHASMLCWICMNEPGALDGDAQASGEVSHTPLMEVYPGPQLYEAVRRHDPSRPAIKGSYCADDLTSGDSHNYTGSLNGEEGHYADIFGTTEKLNTEYGFDAPPALENLEKSPELLRRYLDSPAVRNSADPRSLLREKIASIQDYQYRLLKYYTEHYRMQKYAPNAGYVQFLFSDIGPNSLYGLYDWYGNSKKGVLAMLESNQPVGIFLEYGKSGDRNVLGGVFAVNDTLEDLGPCEAEVTVVSAGEEGPAGETLYHGVKTLALGKDASMLVFDLAGEDFWDRVSVYLVLRAASGKILAANRYEDLFSLPAHVPGHPARMSHETGIRLYDF